MPTWRCGHHKTPENTTSRSCKACRYAYARDRYHGSPAVKCASRESQWRRYGLIGATVEQYNALFRRQAGRCAMCGSLPGKKGLAWDHNHQTGRPRGLLCTPCNVGLGHTENEAFMSSARIYLLQHDGPARGSA